MSNKEIFRQWCENHPEIPLFLQYDWINCIAAPQQWDVALVGTPHDVLAFMPYFKKRKLKFDIITVPPLTPYMGPWIHYPGGQKEFTKRSYEKRLMQELIDQLPDADRFIQYFHPALTNWLPFYWRGFEQSTRYTYILDDLSDADMLYRNLQGNIRRSIAKAKAYLSVVESTSIATLYALKQKDYERKGLKMDFSYDYLQNIHTAMCSKQACKVWTAMQGDTPVASILLVWDRESAYYLAGAVDPDNRSTGAMSLLLWTAILFSSSVSYSFNFEGSMVEPIERYFRSFGAKLTPYMEVRKTDSKLLKLI